KKVGRALRQKCRYLPGGPLDQLISGRDEHATPAAHLQKFEPDVDGFVARPTLRRIEYDDARGPAKLSVRYQLQDGLLVSRFPAHLPPHKPERHPFIEYEINVAALVQGDKTHCFGH